MTSGKGEEGYCKLITGELTDALAIYHHQTKNKTNQNNRIHSK